MKPLNLNAGGSWKKDRGRNLGREVRGRKIKRERELVTVSKRVRVDEIFIITLGEYVTHYTLPSMLSLENQNQDRQ